MAVYKILSPEAWASARAQGGALTMAGVDARDGFIHLSAADQVAGTLALHFADANDLVLVGFDATTLGDALRWEVSRDGDAFPHFYGALPVAWAVGEWRLVRGSDGAFVLPPLA